MSPTATQLFPWTKALETGHAAIDREHQQLLSYLNELAAAMSAGKGRAMLGDLLDKLVAYTQEHFAHEELLMAARKYPESATHKSQHVELTKTVLDFARKFKGGQPVNAPEVMNFLKDWLRSHIGGSDRRLGQWLQKG
jgi:hemerythrin-like metal-binding protein